MGNQEKKEKIKFVDIENRLMVARSGEWGMGEMGEGGSKVNR